MKTGVILFAHGSSVESANEAVREVAREVARQGDFEIMETAFLELARPSLAEAIERVAARGAAHAVVVPYFLTLGIHLRRDLPRLVSECTQRLPHIRIDVTEPLDGHPALQQIVLERAKKAISC